MHSLLSNQVKNLDFSWIYSIEKPWKLAIFPGKKPTITLFSWKFSNGYLSNKSCSNWDLYQLFVGEESVFNLVASI
jgi:hypothetical protein